jgi:hypothetical protein
MTGRFLFVLGRPGSLKSKRPLTRSICVHRKPRIAPRLAPVWSAIKMNNLRCRRAFGSRPAAHNSRAASERVSQRSRPGCLDGTSTKGAETK